MSLALQAPDYEPRAFEFESCRPDSCARMRSGSKRVSVSDTVRRGTARRAGSAGAQIPEVRLLGSGAELRSGTDVLIR